MKKCPQCGQTYRDESLFFCLSDGTSLISAPDAVAPTQFAVPQFNRQQPPASRNGMNPLLVVTIVLLSLMLAGGAILFVVYERLKEKPIANEQRKETPESNRNTARNVSPTPESKTTPSSNVEAPGTPKIMPTMPFAATQKMQYFRVAQTSDGFTSVRAAATTKSAEKGRLFPGTRIECEGTVKGERVGNTDNWYYCPSVGGYIYAKLLTPAP